MILLPLLAANSGIRGGPHIDDTASTLWHNAAAHQRPGNCTFGRRRTGTMLIPIDQQHSNGTDCPHRQNLLTDLFIRIDWCVYGTASTAEARASYWCVRLPHFWPGVSGVTSTDRTLPAPPMDKYLSRSSMAAWAKGKSTSSLRRSHQIIQVFRDNEKQAYFSATPFRSAA